MTQTTNQATKEEQANMESLKHTMYQYIQDNYVGQAKLNMPIPSNLSTLSSDGLAALVAGFKKDGWTYVRVLTNPKTQGVIEFIYEAPKKKTLLDEL